MFTEDMEEKQKKFHLISGIETDVICWIDLSYIEDRLMSFHEVLLILDKRIMEKIFQQLGI